MGAYYSEMYNLIPLQSQKFYFKKIVFVKSQKGRLLTFSYSSNVY